MTAKTKHTSHKPSTHKPITHKDLGNIKFDVDSLKKKLTHPDTQAHELILEIESLKDGIQDMHAIFSKALEEVKEEDVSKTLRNISEKLEAVVSQNETIARGMVAISDKLEDFMHKNNPMQRPPMGRAQHVMGAPPMPGPRMAPRPDVPPMIRPPMPTGAPMPPPPPVFEEKKEKTLGMFK